MTGDRTIRGLRSKPVELWKWDAADLARGIRLRTISSREVVVACLERLDAVNSKINAVVVDLREEALVQADAADRAVSDGAALGALHGVPITLKINVDQIGQATSNGVVAFKDVIAAEDSPVVANFKAAGAIILGRTNTPAFSSNWFTENDLHGRTLNPWSRQHTPGGSSGGASACVAAGITPIAHGTDFAGSVRYPAYCTGVVGLRPSFGRVPTFLSTAKRERMPSGQLMSVHGAIARHVCDVRLALTVMSREDPRDPWWVPAPLQGNALTRPIRVAMSKDPAGVGVHPAVADAVSRAGQWLADAGYAVEEATPPGFADVAAEWKKIALSEAFFSIPAVEQFGDEVVRTAQRWLMQDVPPPDAQEYMLAVARRTAWIRRWNLFCQDYPLLLCPMSFEPPFKQGRDIESRESLLRVYDLQMPSFAIPLVGFPAISVPTGLVDGIPMGVQIVAARFREDLILDAAEIIEARSPMTTPIDPRF